MSASNFKFLQVNSNIEVMREDDNTVYKSLIQEIREDGFLIQEPVYKRFILSLKYGDRVGLGVFTESDRYTFEASVLGVKDDDNLKLYILSQPENVKKHERRNFVRVEAAININYIVLESPLISSKDMDKYQLTQRALAIDLSGGGMMLKVDKALPEKAYLIIEFELVIKGSIQRLRLFGQVMRNLVENRGGVKRYLSGVSFYNLDERTQDKIIAYVFDKMIENIRKT
ncbi:flagellar brake protein [Desulfitibacter alkalitolerans]|uniref:flagellar brake protein n=1 Tax=Desulfitibacter alkalitolerans TaxID=264641 RepID=UPI0004804641|nr:PilZ domain-containing protein [Desulfitibacter alkalitolerans]